MNQTTYSNPVSIEANATTTLKNVPINFGYLVFLGNDGTDDISFTWSNGATWTLKPGDKIADYPLITGSAGVVAKNGTQAFRIWGLI